MNNADLLEFFRTAHEHGSVHYSFIGALIGAGASLLGGLFGKKKQEPQVSTTESVVDYEKMVANAEAAGFNPLTALRNGGSAGFSKTTTTTPVLSSGPTVGQSVVGALANGLTAWANHDPMADARSKLEYKLLEAQLDGVQKSNLRMDRSFFVPTMQGAQAVAGGAELSAKTKGGKLTGEPTAPETGKVEVTNPWQSFSVDPTSRDAAAFENRYGDSEIANMIFGIKNAGYDMWHNMTGAAGPAFESAKKRVDEMKQGKSFRQTYGVGKSSDYTGGGGAW